MDRVPGYAWLMVLAAVIVATVASAVPFASAPAVAAQVIGSEHLGISPNPTEINPRKLVGVQGYGLSVSEWLPLEIPASDSTRKYLKTKKDKLGHKLSSV